jgi:tetratricopeptide (TPR) repeat protein
LANGAYVRAEGIAVAHRRALEQIPGGLSPEVQIRADLLHGRLARARNRIGEALELCRRAEAAARSTGNEMQRAEACTELSLASYRSGDLDACRVWASAGRSAAESCGLGILAARCLEAEARALTDLGRLEEAHRGFEGAALAYDALGDRQGVASSTLGLAWLAWTHGQLDRATRLIREAIPIFEAQGDRSQLGSALSLLGEVHRSGDDLDEAARLYSQALREHRSCGSKIGAGIAQLNLALVHIGFGDWAAARNAIHEVLGSMRGEGADQFANYAELMLLVCDAAESRWEDWGERFAEVRRSVLERGQVHDDLVGLALRCAELASTSGREELAETARAMAHDQLRGLGRADEITHSR